MNNLKIFHNTWSLQQLPASLKMPSLEWRFLLCCDAKTTVSHIQKRLGIADKVADDIVTRLLEAGLLTETPVALDDYARATIDEPSTHAEAVTLTEYLQPPEKAAPPPAPVTPVAPALAPTPAAAPAPSPATPPPLPPELSAPAFRPLQKPSEPVPTRSMSLQSVIQFILNQNVDPTTGQLMTYQVFTGINTRLLKKNGITSLRFQDDRFITDPELQAAIAANIQATLGIPIPEHLYSSLN